RRRTPCLPDRLSPRWWLSHHWPPAMARMSVDHRQPGYWTIRATTSSPIRMMSSSAPGRRMDSSGLEKFLGGGTATRGECPPNDRDVKPDRFLVSEPSSEASEPSEKPRDEPRRPRRVSTPVVAEVRLEHAFLAPDPPAVRESKGDRHGERGRPAVE